MFRNKIIVNVFITALMVPGLALGRTPAAASSDDIAKLKDEGMNRSRAMATIRYLTDVIGARLTNSPNQRRANQWTKEQLEKWGLKNAAVDPWGEFGRGWEIKRFEAAYSTPQENGPLRAFPKAWSPSTPGAITGNVVFVDATDEAGLEKYRGKLKGAIVLTANERSLRDPFEPTARRQSDSDLKKLEDAKPAQPGPQQQFSPSAAMQFNARKNRFYYEEGAAMLIDSGGGVDAGAIRVMGVSLPPAAPGSTPTPGMRPASKGAPIVIPQLVAEVEQYNRLVRIVRQGVPVKITVDLQVAWYDNDLQGYNTIAEIPGTDPAMKDEIVMVGAHLDSWHSGTGATDNGAGTTVAMEAMRIIAATGLKPRRTIRIGLWTGEEQGLLGARGYVAKNFAQRGDGTTPGFGGGGQASQVPLAFKPAHDKFSAYYNLDNGTGQIRGIYMQGNEALRPIFKAWFEPFKDWGASTVTINNTGGTDHLAFDAVGLPGFQFIQDPVEYSSRTWHTTQDVVDRILEEDLKRSAVIMAAFAFNTAMMDEKLPRKDARAAAIASVIPQFNFENELDEIRFRRMGYSLSVCGGDAHGSDLESAGFPAFLAVSESLHNHAE